MRPGRQSQLRQLAKEATYLDRRLGYFETAVNSDPVFVDEMGDHFPFIRDAVEAARYTLCRISNAATLASSGTG